MIQGLVSSSVFVSTTTVLVLLVKLTLLLAVAWLATVALRRRSAAARHFVWALGLGAALVLLPLAVVVPQLAFRTPTALVQSLNVLAESIGDPGRAADTRSAALAPSPDSRTFADGSPGRGTAGSVNDRSAQGPVRQFGSATVVARPKVLLLVAWLVGAAIVLLRLGLGHLALARQARCAVSLADWSSRLANATRRAGVSTHVRLCSSTGVGAPLTWGWRSPIVMLPAGADAWPVDRQSMALEHELAHVARRDYATQLAGALVCAVYWFHPLSWYAARRMRVESEHACDDRVLAAGTSAPDYAEQLLAVARAARLVRLAGAAAVCMARPSHLEGRLLALLDDRRPRHAPSARARLAAVVGLAVLVLPFAALHPAGRAAETPAAKDEAGNGTGREFGRVLEAAPGELLTLDLETGGDVRVRGWDENRVEVNVRLGGADWRDSRVDIARVDGGVRVKSRQRARHGTTSTSHDFEIRVPQRFDVQLHSAGGEVTIIGVEGQVRGQTGGGDLIVERVKGDVRLSTGGGEIQVTDVDARGSVSTGGGMVRMSRVRGGLRGSSGSGPVIYAEDELDSEGGTRAASKSRLGDLDGVRADDSGIEDGRTDARGVLHIERAGGDVVLREAPHGARIMTGGGEIRVGRARGSVEATTGGGDIDIGPVAGSVVASTGAGTVHVELADAAQSEQTVDVSAGVGRVVVDLPAGFDGKFDLETAYTENHGRATRIDSSWNLEREPTTDWDDSEGTPRRYVRAHGVAGSGRGSVRIRTVNGDIIVRRSGARSAR